MGRKMKDAPVYFTIAQVRHNPVLSLDTFVPGIQERMRKAGYPDFKRGLLAAFNLTSMLSADSKETQPLEAQKLERYNFSNAESTRGFILLPNAISYQATQYETFDDFCGEFLKGVEILHAAVGLAFSERIGVRYLDAVVPRDGEEPRQYLVPEVLGLGARLKDASVLHSFTETVIQVPNVGQIVSRIIIQNGPLGFPPDLQPDALKVAERFASVNQVHAVIDTDGGFEGRESFDIAAQKTRLYKLHDEIDKSFHASVTDYARTTWG